MTKSGTTVLKEVAIGKGQFITLYYQPASACWLVRDANAWVRPSLNLAEAEHNFDVLLVKYQQRIALCALGIPDD